MFIRVLGMHVYTTVEGLPSRRMVCALLSPLGERGLTVFPTDWQTPASILPLSAQVCLVLDNLMFYVAAGELHPGPSIGP